MTWDPNLCLATLLCCQSYEVIFNNFQSILTKFYGVNARFYFQDPVLNEFTFVYYIIILFCIKYLFQSNLIGGSDSVVWFGFYMVWIGLEWFMLIYLIKIVWCGFGLDPKPLAP